MAIILNVGTHYTYTKQQLWTELATGETYTAMDWKVDDEAPNMPPGMTATTNAVTGTPTTNGAYQFALTEFDGFGQGPPQPIPVTVEGGADPEPPAANPLAAAVARYLGKPDDPQTLALATEHVGIVSTFVRAYTRGNGFGMIDVFTFEPVDELAHVIISATGRLTPNPEQLKRFQVADYGETPAVLNGFTLPELAVLHMYRRRTA